MLDRWKRAGVTAALCMSALVVACEQDELTTTNEFKPVECPDGQTCSRGGKLDAGVPAFDTGLHADAEAPDLGPPDSGEFADAEAPDLGPLDSGEHPDADPPDLGPADVGFPDSGVPAYLDLTGAYTTRYDLDLSNFFFGISDIAGPLRLIYGLLTDEIDPAIPLLDRWIDDFVASYVPSWLIDVIGVLDTIATFFDVIQVDGQLTLQGSTISPTFQAQEEWDHAIVRVAANCRRSGAPPFPQCAEVLIDLVPQGSPVGPLAIAVDVRDFSGSISPTRIQPGPTGRDTWVGDIDIQDRHVGLDLYRLVLLMVDLAIDAATNGQYRSLSDALDQIIDCSRLRDGAEDFLNSIGLTDPFIQIPALFAVQNGCENVKANVISGVTGGLGGIAISWTAFEFDQIGFAQDRTLNRYPETLQDLAVPNTLDGDFTLVLSDSMGGVWSGITTNTTNP
ncbi:MAG: hypothetical protein HY791_23030 [Deltaproteobacteria bacterium]|nr:hypothetical protein [Deltaproteobacteria bacterium]